MHDPRIFSHPLKRRALYRRAHHDPALAAWIRENDSQYGSRAKLNRFETTVNDIIVAVLLPFGSVLAFTIGNALDAVEEKRHKRGPLGNAYATVTYFMFDPFHRKRLLYTLPESK